MFTTSKNVLETQDQGQFSTVRLHGDREFHASVIIPVNAKGDLATVLPLLKSLEEYPGPYQIEVILVINNYPAESPPEEIEAFRRAGVRVVAEPCVRKPGEVIIISARACGVRAAKSKITIHFDADCKLADPKALINWYIETLQKDAGLAYSHVRYYDCLPLMSVRVKIALHHFFRFLKRRVAGIPTTRGSNYAIRKELFETLYDQGKLAVDLHVGPAVKLMNGKVVYSGRRAHDVFTSGRRFKGGWGKLSKYFRYRLLYNIHSLAVLRSKNGKNDWDGFDKENQKRQSFTTKEPTRP